MKLPFFNKKPKDTFRSTSTEIGDRDLWGSSVMQLHFVSHDGQSWTRPVDVNSIGALLEREDRRRRELLQNRM